MSRQSLSGWRATCAVGISVASLALVLASYDRPAADDVAPLPATGQGLAQTADLADRLQGTWLREHEEDGVQSRRLLRLDPGGTFSEQVRIVSPAGQVSRHAHAGTWLYEHRTSNGQYTLMNGRAPSRLNLPFATFEIRFESTTRSWARITSTGGRCVMDASRRIPNCSRWAAPAPA